MKNIKSFLLAALFVSATLITYGQGFEWVKAYSGTDRFENMNQIKGSFVDAQGNIYIVGNMSAWGEILGVELLPREINRGAYNRQCVVIAKISPDGQLVWHKPIYSSGYDCDAHALSRMGDTAFMVMCRTSLKHYYDSYPPSSLYFLDTMLTSADEGYLTSKDSTWCGGYATFFITFDLDGNVLERHSLEVGYIDSSGTVITYGVAANDPSYRYATALYTDGLSHETFAIDHDGNIYVIRRNCDFVPMLGHTISTQDGTISALKIMVNGRHSFVHQLDMPSPYENLQLLKFAPHFDSLIGGVYMFDSSNRNINEIETYSIYMSTDLHNNLYVNHFAIQNNRQQLYVHNSDSLYIDARKMFGYVVVYNTDLIPESLIQLTSDDTNSVTGFGLYNYCMDWESNSIFVMTDIYWPGILTTFFYNGDSISVPRKGTALWLRIDLSSYDLLSYGYAVPLGNGGAMSWGPSAAKNNRLFAQIQFWGVEFADTTIEATSGYDMAFFIWGYNGDELLIKDYNVESYDNLKGLIHVVDSAVYLTGTMNEDATFDTITLRSTGHSQAYVARYVDTAFMHPYVHREGNEGQSIPRASEPNYRLTLYPNPTTGVVQVGCDGCTVKEAAVISTLGHRERVACRDGRIDLSHLAAGVYYLEVRTDTGVRREKITKL